MRGGSSSGASAAILTRSGAVTRHVPLTHGLTFGRGMSRSSVKLRFAGMNERSPWSRLRSSSSGSNASRSSDSEPTDIPAGMPPPPDSTPRSEPKLLLAPRPCTPPPPPVSGVCESGAPTRPTDGAFVGSMHVVAPPPHAPHDSQYDSSSRSQDSVKKRPMSTRESVAHPIQYATKSEPHSFSPQSAKARPKIIVLRPPAPR